MQGYKDLRVYEKSYKAARAIYQLSEGFPKEEMYAITSQIRRAGLSIPLNIAKDLGYISRERHEKASREYEEISKMLSVFIKKVEEQSKRSKI